MFKRTRKTIVFDLDDVIFNMKDYLKSFMVGYYNLIVEESDLSDYGTIKRINMTDIIKSMKKQDGMFNFHIREDALEFNNYMWELYDRYWIIISTARSCWGDKNLVETNTRIQLCNNNIPHHDVIISDFGKKLKGIKNVFMFIDDNPTNLLPYKNSVNNLILFDQPWNKDFKDATIKRIKSLEELKEIL